MTRWKDWREKRREAKERKRRLLRQWERHENEYALEHVHEESDKDYYDLYNLSEQWDKAFLPMSLAVMNELLAPFWVVKQVEAWGLEKLKRRKKQQESRDFPAWYYHELKERGGAENAWYDQETGLITITKGLDLPLMMALLSEGNGRLRSNSVRLYGYRANPPAHADVRETKAALNRESCAVFMTPDDIASYLEIVIQGGEPDRKSVLDAIRRVCDLYGLVVWRVQPGDPADWNRL